jgi:cytoskeletal protein CcmA (bactofilin family)
VPLEQVSDMAKNLMSVFGGEKAVDASDAQAEAQAEATTAALGAQSSRLPVIVLGKTLSFKGELSADEDLMLFGRVEGTINHTSALTVGVGGVVIGDIRAKVITIKGTVEGDLEATESITVTPTGSVLGDIAAPRVCIVEGAQFNGAVEMTEAPPVVAAKTTAPDAATPAGADAVLNEKAVDRILGDR